jgi:UDP-glucose 4-epimerase
VVFIQWRLEIIKGNSIGENVMGRKIKKVIMTGGLGFVGSHLVEHLLARGIELIIIDNLSTNVVPINFFDSAPGCTIISEAIEDVDLTLSEFSDVDTVFHLASILGPSGLLKHAGNIGGSIFNDTIKIRDFCSRTGSFLIDISTSEIYGHPGLLEEDSDKVFPGGYKIRTEYGVGKLLAELAVVNKARVDKSFNYHIIRPFNITGPRQLPDGGFVLPRFVISALTNQPITVFGDGTQRRAFTHVQDVCDAILAIMDSSYFNEAWNIGRPENEMSIKDMADLVLNEVTSLGIYTKSNIIFIDPTIIHGPLFTEVVDKIPYVEKIGSLIGWEAYREAKKIVSDTVSFYYEKIRHTGYYFKVM